MATKTWIVIGDSNASECADGKWRKNFLHLISTECDVAFKNLSSPGAALGAPSALGFNRDSIIDTMDAICGMGNVCDGIVIQAGSNDLATNLSSVGIPGPGLPWSDVNASLNRILDWAVAKKAQKPTFRVLMMIPVWRFDANTTNYYGLTLYNYQVGMAMKANAYSSVAITVPAPGDFVNSTTLFGASEVAQNKQLHWNPAGHRIVADALKAVAAAHGIF